MKGMFFLWLSLFISPSSLGHNKGNKDAVMGWELWIISDKEKRISLVILWCPFKKCEEFAEQFTELKSRGRGINSSHSF